MTILRCATLATADTAHSALDLCFSFPIAMPRRKKLTVVNLRLGESYSGRTASNVCPRDLLEQKYDEALSGNRSEIDSARVCHGSNEELSALVTLDLHDQEDKHGGYLLASAEPTIYHVDSTPDGSGGDETDIRGKAPLEYVRRATRTSPSGVQFIEGTLTEEYGLDNVEIEKPLLEADDFVEVIRHHWASDINVFPNERQRLQLAANPVAGGVHRSRPQALLNLTYRDLDLYIEKNAESGVDMLRLGVKLTKTKSRQKRTRPKTYTVDLDDNPIFCVITHIVSLAFDDSTCGPPDLDSPDVLFRLRARRDKGCQPIPWRKDMMDVPIFRWAVATKEGVKTSTEKVLTYNVYQAWVRRLGEALGYLQTLTMYCLRRALGNAINGA
ncbi:hypothetical protein LTR93_011344 [Exophiala xenobiotica]|nr:hypothetical protein LTR93_011344 [Exophiala xenobiotica]